MSGSEIARLRAQIEKESNAAWHALYGLAHAGKHEIISNRYTNIGKLVEELKREVGEDAALLIAMEALDKGSTQVVQ